MTGASEAERISPIAERLPRLFGGMEDLLELAVETIDAQLGRGYAEKHPQLIQALLTANALHALSEGLDDRLLRLAGGLDACGDALDNLKGAVRELGKRITD